MKNIFKNRLFLVIITALLCITGSVCASTIFARDIKYGNTNVESALNDLYDKTSKIGYHYENSFNTSGVKTIGELDFEPKYLIASWNTGAGTQLVHAFLDIDNNTSYFEWSCNAGICSASGQAIGTASNLNSEMLRISSNNTITICGFGSVIIKDLKLLVY